MGMLTPFVWQPMPLEDVALVAALAFLSLSGNICLVMAFNTAEVGVITPFEYTGLVWAVVLGFVFFSDFPAFNVWVGVAAIGASGLYMVYRENKRR
jgi:drug/metabolite transporter (DMT)-like permease